MSIEQTTQLIQLILNSTLLIVGCALMSNRLGERHSTIVADLQTLLHQYAELRALPQKYPPSEHQLILAKKQLRQLQGRYVLTHSSLLAGHAALLLAIGSGFLLALRAVLMWDWLISVACGLFVVGLAALLLGTGLTLLDMNAADRALWEEVRGVLNLGRAEETLKSSSTRPRFGRSRRAAREKPPLTRVG
ncbi:MAG TPA: DUF2721 domain-containing protein [Thermosynechococcaceae cyanobacterium]